MQIESLSIFHKEFPKPHQSNDLSNQLMFMFYENPSTLLITLKATTQLI